ncbi:unnamed protein product [Paramecium sonneborni]|uniref:Uncharacterized protein n=1 Tax=Paramecium sonneborni TaxID=65129 RepID=A0A8S1PT42_9CILI|nr:unnamed protein product [Paramecium sonneborni]
MKESDVNLKFLTNSYIDEGIALKYIRQEINLQIKLSSKLKNWPNLPEFIGIEIDMCFNNILGVINTKFIEHACQLKKKVQQEVLNIKYLGGILLKLWGKKQG